MKKFLTLALITIMALVCTACANAAADTDVSYNQPNLKYGRYYLNGDVNSKLYIDLDENYIVMGNEEELRKFLEEYCSAIDDYSTEELYKENVEEAINGYGVKSEYNYMTINPGTIIHVIIFDYFKFGTFDENTVTGVYYEYVATVYKGNIIKNLIMDCQSYTKYRPNETTGGIFVSWRRKEELPTGA